MTKLSGTRMKFFSVPRCLLSAALVIPATAFATNGMNMEGYGPIALGMGGASMAYDNGTAAMMNNVATLGLMEQGDVLDLAVGFLGPDVSAEAAGMTAESDGTAYFMPAVGWLRKRGELTFGLGMYGQGGMGTEFAPNSWMRDPGGIGAALENRTELSVGRVIAPLAFNVNERLTLGGSVDFVWAGLDLRMAMSEAQFVDLATTQNGGSASGSLLNSFGAMYAPFNGGAGPVQSLNHAYFDYSNDNRFSGRARGYGWAGKLGLVYQATPALSVGLSYHSETALSDMKTDTAVMSMSVEADFGGGLQTHDIPVSGTIKVEDFQWPATWAAGAAWQASDRWLLALDVKRIQWASVMDSFRMKFVADSTQGNALAGGFAGQELEAALFQRWDNQTVLSVGAAYQYNSRLTLRGGVNKASNPVPNAYLNALFPAIVEEHLTAGFSYAFSDQRALHFALSRALPVSFTNPGDPANGIPPVTSRHSQLNWQLIYTIGF